MSGDITKNVKVHFGVGGLDAIAKQMRSMDASARRATSAVEGIQRQLGGLKRMAMGGLAGYGLFQLGKGLVEVNAKAETMALGFATVIQSADKMRGKMTPFTSALGEAGDMMAMLRKEAVETPGTFEQVAGAFQTIGLQARAAGMDNAGISKLAGNIATLETFTGTGVTSKDVQQLLRGEAGDVATPQLMGIKKQVAALARSGKQAEALKRITSALEMDPAARKAFGESFEGQVSTFKDQLTEIQKIAGKPLFEAANKALKDMSAWLGKNQAKVEKIARDIGEGIVKAVKAVIDAVAWLHEHHLLGIVATVAVISKAFGGLGPILSLLAKNPLFAAIAAAAAGLAFLRGDPGKEVWGVRPGDSGQKISRSEILQMQAAGGSGWSIAKDASGRGFGITGPGGRTFNSVAAADMLKGIQKYPSSRDAYMKEARNELAGNAGVNATASSMMKSIQQRAAVLGQGNELISKVNWRTQLATIAKSKFEQTNNFSGTKINVEQKIETDDPSRIAGATLAGAFGALVRRPLSASFGLGSVGLATGD